LRSSNRVLKEKLAQPNRFDTGNQTVSLLFVYFRGLALVLLDETATTRGIVLRGKSQWKTLLNRSFGVCIASLTVLCTGPD